LAFVILSEAKNLDFKTFRFAQGDNETGDNETGDNEKSISVKVYGISAKYGI